MKNNNVKLIGICGAAQSGKDTVASLAANILIDTDNRDFTDHVIAVESFASPIKSMTAMLLDFFGYGSIMNPSTLNPYLEGDKKEEVLENLGVSTRTIMQTLGTDWGRKMIHPDIWIRSMEERIKHYGEADKHGHKGAFVLISDVRFDNECEMIKNNGGVIVKVLGDGDIIPKAGHISELGVSPCMVDSYINNDDDLEVLKERTTAYLEGLLEGKLTYDEYEEVIIIPEEIEEADSNEKD